MSERGIENYAPLTKTIRQWSDRKKTVELPLISGYVFVNISEKENPSVLQTKGVVNFVKSEGKVALIREEEIDRLKQLVSLGYQLEATGMEKRYTEGDKVKINAGALKGIEGYITETRESRHIEVLLESIGQCIRVKLPRELLLKVEA